MNETKVLGDIIRDQEYAAAREFIRRKYPITELGATALMEFSLERNEYFRKIAEQAQQIVTAVVNTTVMPPIIVGSAETGGEKAAPHLKYRTIRNKREALAESSLSSPPRMLPADKSLGDVPHFGCEYPRGICDCYAGVEEEKW